MDSINIRRAHFHEFWSFAVAKGFRVYVAELPRNVQVRRAWMLKGRWDKALPTIQSSRRHVIAAHLTAYASST